MGVFRHFGPKLVVNEPTLRSPTDREMSDTVGSVVRSSAAADFEGLAIAYGQRDGAGCVGRLESPATLALEAELPAGEATAGFLPMAVADLDGDGVADVVT